MRQLFFVRGALFGCFDACGCGGASSSQCLPDLLGAHFLVLFHTMLLSLFWHSLTVRVSQVVFNSAMTQ